MSASNHSGRFLSSCGSCVFRRGASVLLLALAVSLSMLSFARAETRTSTGSRYGVEAFAHTLEKYSSIMELVAGRGTVPIPGAHTTLGDDALASCDHVTIYGKAGSPAQAYAEEYSEFGVSFIAQ